MNLKRVCIGAMLAGALYCQDAFAAEDWTTGDTIAQVVTMGLIAIDWRQSRQIARNPDRYAESNPVLGEHPSMGRVNTYFALFEIGHLWLARTVPHGVGRDAVQYAFGGAELVAVVGNHSVGLSYALSF